MKLDNFSIEVKKLAQEYARNFYGGLIDSGLNSHQALDVMRVYSLYLNDYVPVNYKPNKKEVPRI